MYNQPQRETRDSYYSRGGRIKDKGIHSRPLAVLMKENTD